ncbi:MAG: protein-glutamate O-methyltransferase CheR [Gemmatimonadaceae bacterium]
MTMSGAFAPTSMTHGVELTPADFARVAQLMRAVAGIELRPGKEGLVRSRLSRRLRTLHLQSVREYLDRVERESGQELAHMVDALTTNKTEFFREHTHFELLEQTVLPGLARRGGPIRIWCAGCSTGEEPYSVAMSAHQSLGPAASRVRVLATDISGRVLETARRGIYGATSLRSVPLELRRAFFDVVTDSTDESTYQVNDRVRRLVRFAKLNLMATWPMRGHFDVIFCRNVMIYFSRQVQQQLVDRFTERLSPGGILLLGHSESLTGIRHALRYLQPAAYGT